MKCLRSAVAFVHGMSTVCSTSPMLSPVFSNSADRLDRDPYWCRLWPAALALAEEVCILSFDPFAEPLLLKSRTRYGIDPAPADSGHHTRKLLIGWVIYEWTAFHAFRVSRDSVLWEHRAMNTRPQVIGNMVHIAFNVTFQGRGSQSVGARKACGDDVHIIARELSADIDRNHLV
jgi:hypothetical protein